MRDALFFLAGLAFAGMALRVWIYLPWAQRLPPLNSAPTGDLPRCSVVIAARNEEARIEATIRRLLAQQHIAIEIIPVDDRSDDGTSSLLQSLSREDARVRPKRVEILPEGWLGKCHACHIGASSATGDWILFTDADCWLKPDVIARAVQLADRERVEHVALTPGVMPQTLPAAAWHIAFLMTLADWFGGVNQDKPNAHFGMGAFNLVRTSTYRECGGYERLRLTVVDDIKLGRLVRLCGKRTRGFIGGDDTECHWGVTVRDIIKIMEKNYFAAIDYRTWAALTVGLALPLLWVTAVYGLFTGTLLGTAAGVSLLASIIPAIVLARRLRWSIKPALFVPFVFPALYYAVLRSTIITLRQGGIRWRGNFYPLELLRAQTVK
jgi:glycosyltransferase involved in cell wall biosynthesis